MAIHVTPIPKLSDFATPSITIGASASAGTADTVIRSDSTIAGVALITSVDNTIARFTGTAGQLQGYTSTPPTATDVGIVVLPGQPAFAAILTSLQSDKTGDDTVYTIPYDSTRLNQGAVFNTTNAVFTAPVAGQYLLSATVEYSGATTSTTERVLRFVTSNLAWAVVSNFTLANRFSISASIIADMDSSDTVYVTLSCGGDGSKVIDIAGDASGRTNFCGCLIA